MVDLRALNGRNNGSQHPASANEFTAIRSQDTSQPVLSAQSIPAQKAATPGDNATAPEKAVRAQTIKFNFRRRRQLRYQAFRAEWTGAEDWWLWWLRQRKKYPNGFEEFFVNNVPLFGNTIYKWIKPRISSDLTRQLEGLIDSKGEPFLIIRGVFSGKFLQASLTRTRNDDPQKADPEKSAALLQKRRYDLVASALIAATKTDMRRKLEQDTPYRDYFTEVSAEINQFGDGTDMHLRYRTATPELPPATKGLNTAARVIVFACIENPIADPIYLIRAEDVISKIPTEKKARLCEPNFNIFDKWTDEIDMHAGAGSNKCILHDGTDWLSFDPNRVCPAKIDAIHNATMRALLDSIQEVAETSARKIVLRRGDALIVDNYRALTRRQQHGYASFFNNPTWMRSRPPIRWLRVYYGFPRSRIKDTVRD
jgi:hypothetical protein